MSKLIAKETFFSVKADKRVFEGEEVAADSVIALAHPEKFSGSKTEKIVEKVEEPKEELLVEEPVAELEVTVEEKPKKKSTRRKKKDIFEQDDLV